jgi:hypothetical protein
VKQPSQLINLISAEDGEDVFTRDDVERQRATIVNFNQVFYEIKAARREA